MLHIAPLDGDGEYKYQRDVLDPDVPEFVCSDHRSILLHLLCCDKISERDLSRNSSTAELCSNPLVQYKSLMIPKGYELVALL